MNNTRRTVSPTKPGGADQAVQDGKPRGGSLDDILGLGNNQVADSKVAVKANQRSTVRRVQEVASLVEKAGGAQREDAREKILAADFDSVQTLATQEETDFAEALEALQQVATDMDLQFKQLIELSPEESSKVNAAKQMVAGHEQKLREKQASKINIFGSREKAVASIQRDLDLARQKVGEVEVEVQQSMRQRLMTAQMKTSIEAYVAVSGKTSEIMKQRVIEVAEQIGILGNRRVEALAAKSNAAEKMKQLEGKLRTDEIDLHTKEGELEGLTNGTPEYAAKEQEISDLKVKVEETRGAKDVALAFFQSKEVFAQRLELALHTAMKLKDRHKARIARLESDTEERVATYQARLVTMQVMADQKFDDLLDQIGVTLDQRTDEYMASAMVAADDALMKSFEGQPDKIKKHMIVRATIAEHIANMRTRGAKVEEDLRNRYGVNTGDGSFFSYGATPTDDSEGGALPKST